VTASTLLGLIALILFTAFGVTVAVLVSKALSRAFLQLDQMQVTSAQERAQLLDRLMTIRWEDYVAVQSLEEADVGGFIAPGEEQEEITQVIPRRQWSLFRNGEPTQLTEDEETILREDFPEG